LARFLPVRVVEYDGERYFLDYNRPQSIGKVRKFYGVVPVALRVYAYIMGLGADGLREVAELSVLNNNYLLKKLLQIKGISLPMAEGKVRLEQARFSWEELLEETGVGTDDLNKRVVDYGLQSYFTSHHPRIVPEPFTPEPVETYSRDDMDEYVSIIKTVVEEAYSDPQLVKNAPHRAPIASIDPEPLQDIERFACTWRGFKRKQSSGETVENE